MVEGDDGLDAVFQKGVDEVPVVLDPLLVDGAGPVGKDPAPGDGEAVGGEAHLLHQGHVLPEMVVLIAGHLGGGEAEGLVAVLVYHVLLRGFFSVLIGGALHLVGAGGGPPEKALGKLIAHN